MNWNFVCFQFLRVFALGGLLLCLSTSILFAATISATPSDYLAKLPTLEPGDTLLLAAGIYNDPDSTPGLPIYDLHGEPGNSIIITGPESGPRPVFEGRVGTNTVRFSNASYIELRNIVVDSRDRGGDGINSQGISHHITLENILIRGVGPDQSVVGISTNRAPTWNWTIRNCRIENAGTGMYLGDSDGGEPFVNGIIENNVIVDTIGYNIEIKHQKVRPDIPGMPIGDSTTIIRNNVFSKLENSSSGVLARPNVLVGHFPPTGPGANDVYQIYGNFFYHNPSGEPLFQGEGNIALYNNLFVNNVGDAVLVQPHNDIPKEVRIFNNTIVASGVGIRVTGGTSDYEQKVIGNAVFAGNAITATDQFDNVTNSFDAAVDYLNNPTGNPIEATLDLYPQAGMLVGTHIDSSSFDSFRDWDSDFNGTEHSGNFRGAYSGEGTNPGWYPQLTFKPGIGSTVDVTPPASPTGLSIN